MEVYAGIISSLDDNVAADEGVIRWRAGQYPDPGVLRQRRFAARAPRPRRPTCSPRSSAAGALEQTAELYDVMASRDLSALPDRLGLRLEHPLSQYKQYVHLGGVADPLHRELARHRRGQGAIRRQFVHVVDLFPTRSTPPGSSVPIYQGRPQKPLEAPAPLRPSPPPRPRPAPSNITNSAAHAARSSRATGGSPRSTRARAVSRTTNGALRHVAGAHELTDVSAITRMSSSRCWPMERGGAALRRAAAPTTGRC